MLKHHMQRLILGIILALATQLCFAKSAQDPLSTIHAYMAAWNEHDAEKAASFFAEDGEFLDSSVGTPQKGRDAARDNVIKVFMTAVPDLRWQLVGTPVVQGDSVAFEWQFDGKNTGPWSAELPATNKPLKFNGVSLIRLKGGKIVSQHDYYDALGFNRQLGW
ncbi:SgcJ/EcaC family oxidoreductase [Pseudomonas rhizoryzae]|uniref:ester cyclase n=1 Tax=Pseudomonas rhizoryzae TaxID=2571129 RepID=UPI000B1BFB9C